MKYQNKRTRSYIKDIAVLDKWRIKTIISPKFAQLLKNDAHA
jgi:hypothetical protein